MTKRKEDSSPVKVAIVGAIATIIVAVITGIFAVVLKQPSASPTPPPIPSQISVATSPPSVNSTFDYSIRVQTSDTGMPVANAKVTIEVIGQAPLDEIADSNGIARFLIDSIRVGQPARLIARAVGYKSYSQNIDLRQGTLPDVIPLDAEQTVLPPTQTPLPMLSSPTPISTQPSVSSLVIEDFERYDDNSLANTFKINRNAGNDAKISLVGVPHVSQGNQALAFEYNIRNSEPDNYIGLNRLFPTQDWSAYSALCMWVESDNSNRTLVIQFGETESKYQKKTYSLANGTGDYCIPLKDQQYIDLKAVNYYGIYVEGPPKGQSIIYIDNVRLEP